MPIYEYVCEACGRITEVMQRMSDPAPAACPGCGAPKLSRLVSRTSFQLKGGGWYADLYSTPKEKKAGGEGSGGAKPSEGAKAPSGASGGAASTGTAAASGGGTPGKGSGGGTT